MHEALIRLGLTQSKYDPMLYFKLLKGKLVGAITTHVDNLAIIGETFVTKISSDLKGCFEVSADEELHHFLSISITRDVEGQKLFMSQQHYIEDLQTCFLPNSHVSVSTPTDVHFKDLLSRKDDEKISPGPYSSLIGALLWVVQCTQANVSSHSIQSMITREWSIIGR